MKLYLLLILVFVSMLSCEKTIQITNNISTPKVVVDASIENGMPPIIILSKSFGYYATIDSTIITNSFIHQATIQITPDGGPAYLLKEYKMPVLHGDYYYYSCDTTNSSTIIKGVMGKQYLMTVNYQGQTYSASTQIPMLTKKIDSLWYKSIPNYPDSPQVVVMATVTDPPGLGNYIRYFTKQNSGDFYPGLNSVFDDQIVDGKTYSIQIDKGVDRNQKLDRANYGFFLKGDTVTVKLCNIDQSTYNFWRTWEYAYQSIGNPFSSPGKVIGNFNNGALGAFCGYSVQYKSLIIPK